MRGDRFTPAERSAVMRKVKARNTGPELEIRRTLTRLGLRYRLHRKDLPGSPDIVFGGRKLAIFVHGCFWHGHDCKRGARRPQTNADYWEAKIGGNRARDQASLDQLQGLGWRALVIWECDLKHEDRVKRMLSDALETPANLAINGQSSRILQSPDGSGPAAPPQPRSPD